MYYKCCITPQNGVIFMYVTPNLFSTWGGNAIRKNRAYAEKHGYTFIIMTKPFDPSVTHAWQKIFGMMQILQNKSYDFIFYIDADAVFYKTNTTIEQIMHNYTGDVVMCSDEGNSGGKYAVNGGTVFVRNNTASMKLLEQWWNLRHSYKEFAFEQWAMSDIIRGHVKPSYDYTISVAPERHFNSLYSDMLSYTLGQSTAPDTFVHHFMAMNDDVRSRYIT